MSALPEDAPFDYGVAFPGPKAPTWDVVSEDQQRRDLDAFRARFEAATGLTADTVRLPGGELVPFDQLRADPRLYALDVPRWRRPLARWWRTRRTSAAEVER